MMQEWNSLTLIRVSRRDSLLDRQQKFAAKRFFGKLRLITQIAFVKRNVIAKLEAFRENRLKQKTFESFRIYLVSKDCQWDRDARKLRAKQLKKRALQALSICA